jgi:tRNA-2-methylthio-N6-dimethylallyladenosine synthase
MARDIIPDLAVTTDIIVGFPGETDEDFEATMDVVTQAQYDAAYTFVFSPREGTEAALMTDKFVDADIVNARMDRLCALEKADAKIKHAQQIGKTEELMVVSTTRNKEGMISGRTTQNKLVHFDPRGENIPEGSYVIATVTDAASHWLFGDLISVVSKPAAKKKLIPVMSS